MTTLLTYLDKQEPHLVMQAVQSMYEDDSRGIFCSQFVPYKDLVSLGYKGFRQFLLSLYEMDDNFITKNKGELANLKSQIQRLKGEIPNEY